jgi:ribosomal protein L3
MLNQVYATKLSSSQAFKEGKRIPLTILKVDSHTVTRQKTVDVDGYSSTVLALGSKTKHGKTSPKYLKDSPRNHRKGCHQQLILVRLLSRNCRSKVRVSLAL